MAAMRLARRVMVWGFAFISLLLFIATVAVWIRSYWTSDFVSATRFRSWEAQASGGEFMFTTRLKYPSNLTRNLVWPYPSPVGPPQAELPSWRFVHYAFPANSVLLGGGPSGFGLSTQIKLPLGIYGVPRPRTFEYKVMQLLVPAWSIAVLTFIAPVWWIFRWSRRGFGPGLCANCGYDLRATPERCPECGKEVGD